METINRALGIIELQSRLLAAPLPPRPISLDALLPSSGCAVETLLVAAEAFPPAPELVTFEDSRIFEKDMVISPVCNYIQYIIRIYLNDNRACFYRL